MKSFVQTRHCGHLLPSDLSFSDELGARLAAHESALDIGDQFEGPGRNVSYFICIFFV
ncbi:hypothetical protein CDL15_Pgr012458 [Punica granatum]|uniref:Uncharacterized protein n=1 Tax=Punica granatum TaxID=22663 RepID=A0A218WZ00_PUNGR|nr:hypothetical protein CDL15_Pgr012458 [Punica granatum]